MEHVVQTARWARLRLFPVDRLLYVRKRGNSLRLVRLSLNFRSSNASSNWETVGVGNDLSRSAGAEMLGLLVFIIFAITKYLMY